MVLKSGSRATICDRLLVFVFVVFDATTHSQALYVYNQLMVFVPMPFVAPIEALIEIRQEPQCIKIQLVWMQFSSPSGVVL